MTAEMFLSKIQGLRVVLDLFLIAVAGGLYIVPLRAMVQERAPPERRARVVAASSLCDAIFVFLSVIASTVLLWFDFEIRDIFALTGLVTFGVSILILRSKNLNLVLNQLPEN